MTSQSPLAAAIPKSALTTGFFERILEVIFRERNAYNSTNGGRSQFPNVGRSQFSTAAS